MSSEGSSFEARRDASCSSGATGRYVCEAILPVVVLVEYMHGLVRVLAACGRPYPCAEARSAVPECSGRGGGERDKQGHHNLMRKEERRGPCSEGTFKFGRALSCLFDTRTTRQKQARTRHQNMETQGYLPVKQARQC